MLAADREIAADAVVRCAPSSKNYNVTARVTGRLLMRSMYGLVLAAFGLVHGTQANAQTPPQPSEPGTATAASFHNLEDEAHAGLRQLQATMEKALNSGDVETILANVDDNVVFTTMNDDVARGKKGIREYFEKMMKGPERVVDSVTTHFEPDDLSILHGNDTAIAFGHAHDHYVLTNGRAFDITARWSGTMLRRDGKWIVASFHYSTNVFDNPILTAQRRLLIGVGAAIAVLAAGVAFWLGRRRRQ
jgi:uncharacterized protein (TIGR02246 family)